MKAFTLVQAKLKASEEFKQLEAQSTCGGVRLTIGTEFYSV